MRAVQYMKNVPRYLVVRALSGRWPGVSTGAFSCIRLTEVDPPRLPSPAWARVRTRLSGICGSDLATIRARGSPYFSPMTSSPFVFGHEIVGEVTEAGPEVTQAQTGDRVVIEPALCCPVRGVSPPCIRCAHGDYGNCEQVMHGDLAPGIQTGYCRDTGGGWSAEFVAHTFQLHPVPDRLSDEEAVLIEPFACCLHAALQARPADEATVLVIGCGAIGLLIIAALRATGSTCRILAAARYPHQQAFARDLGADAVISGDLYDAVAQETGAERHRPEIGKPTVIGGVETTFDCVGAARTIDDALRLTRAKGTVAVVGMPAIPSGIDWTSIWYKELRVLGAYAYGTETFDGARIRTFDLAIRLMESYGGWIKPLVTKRFALEAYREALGYAMQAGRSGAVKTVFDFRAPAPV